jgi:hypothetical protein
MKRKTKRKCNNKRRCTRRKMRGGNGISLEDYRINLFKTQELLQDPTIQKKLEEEEKKEEKENEESLTGLAFNYAKRYADAYINGLEATIKMAEMANNPQALLAGQLGPMAGQLAGPMAGQLASQIPTEISASQIPNPMDKLAEIPNPMDKLSEIPNPMDKLAEIPNPMAELSASQIPNPMADKPQSGGKSNKNKLPNPIFPLLRTKEASIIGGRIESSISKFLG